MSHHRFRFVVAVIVLTVGVCVAKDFWQQPFEKWNNKQVVAVLGNSPWAQAQTEAIPIQGINSGAYGEKELYITLTARFFSSLPVRQAYVRMMELQNHYDEMNAEQRDEFAKRFSRALKLDVSNRVIVAVEISSNLPQWNRDSKQYFESNSSQTLKQNVYLIVPRIGRVQMVEYYPPSNDGTGAKFVFPRQIDGKPILDPADKEIDLEYNFSTSSFGDKFLIHFNVDKMIYQGELSY